MLLLFVPHCISMMKLISVAIDCGYILQLYNFQQIDVFTNFLCHPEKQLEVLYGNWKLAKLNAKRKGLDNGGQRLWTTSLYISSSL